MRVGHVVLRIEKGLYLMCFAIERQEKSDRVLCNGRGGIGGDASNTHIERRSCAKVYIVITGAAESNEA